MVLLGYASCAAGCARARRRRFELAARDGTEVNFIRTIDEAKRPPPGPQVSERGVVRQAHRAERLNGAIDNPHLKLRRGDLNRGNLRARRLVALRVHQPCRMEAQQARLVDLDP